MKLIISPQNYINKDEINKQIKLYTKLIIFTTIIKTSIIINLANMFDMVNDFQYIPRSERKWTYGMITKNALPNGKSTNKTSQI